MAWGKIVKFFAALFAIVNVITRIMGIVLSAIAVQMIFSGARVLMQA